MNLEMCQKTIKLLGGNMFIRSDVKTGVETIITIDQRKVIPKEGEDKFSSYVKYQKDVAIVCQNKNIIKSMKSVFKNYNLNPIFYYDGYDLLEQVKGNHTYDFIITANEMKKINGYNLLKELKGNYNIACPVMIMVDSKHESIAKALLDEGFADAIYESNLRESLEKIIEKY